MRVLVFCDDSPNDSAQRVGGNRPVLGSIFFFEEGEVLKASGSFKKAVFQSACTLVAKHYHRKD